MTEPEAKPDGNPPSAFRTALDTFSKIIAIAIAFIYISGFLITSLNDFRYGFSVMNPFRPRILAAGGWFFLFLAIPVELLRILTRHPLWKQSGDRWYKVGALMLQYFYSAVFIAFPANIFILTNGDHANAQPPHWWTIALYAVFVAAVISFMNLKKTPKTVKTVLAFVLLVWFVWSEIYSGFVQQQFGFGAMQLWLCGIGALAIFEMKLESWKRDRTNLIYWYMATIIIFATAYYPHISAPFGGGATIPVGITFTKDFLPVPNQTIGCMLIDETDSGFYVIGKDEKHATFIPRSAVALIHFADASEHSIFSPSAK